MPTHASATSRIGQFLGVAMPGWKSSALNQWLWLKVGRGGLPDYRPESASQAINCRSAAGSVIPLAGSHNINSDGLR